MCRLEIRKDQLLLFLRRLWFIVGSHLNIMLQPLIIPMLLTLDKEKHLYVTFILQYQEKILNFYNLMLPRKVTN